MHDKERENIDHNREYMKIVKEKTKARKSQATVRSKGLCAQKSLYQ